MKTTLRTWFALALAIVLALAPTSLAVAQTTGAYNYWWQVTDERGEPYVGENVQCSVFRPNTHAAAIIHTASTLASGGNSPLWSDVNGKLHFYSALNTPVDITCYYAGGGYAQINKFRISDHKIVIPRQAGTVISRFAVNSTSATYQSDSGLVIPAGALIRDVIIQNLAPRGLGTYHLSVGFLGNHGVATSSALVLAQALTSPDEWLRPHLVSFTALATHRGAALTRTHAANNAYMEQPYLVHVSSGLSVSYSAQPGTAAAVRAHVYLLWQKLHTAADRFGLRN